MNIHVYEPWGLVVALILLIVGIGYTIFLAKKDELDEFWFLPIVVAFGVIVLLYAAFTKPEPDCCCCCHHRHNYCCENNDDKTKEKNGKEETIIVNDKTYKVIE